MKIGMGISYTGDPKVAGDRAADLERAGVDMLWAAELYSFDLVSILGYLAARTETVELASGIMPLYSRSPTLIGMTAAGLDAVSGGRFVLGLGASGPQVIEGWHGVPYTKPLAATRDVIEICRKVWRREVVEHHGEVYELPLPPDQGTGLGKPLKIINHPVRDSIPIYLASLGPKNVAMTAEIADGWLPTIYHPDKARDVWGPDLDAGLAIRDPSLPPLEVAVGGTVAICDEHTAQKLRDRARPGLALYIGGMGARNRNFYNNTFRKYGYEAEADEIQDLFLSGKKDEAAAAIPEEYLKATVMAGDEGFVRERVRAYVDSGVTQLRVQPAGDDPLSLIEKVKAWAE
ncbi:MAG: LLM class F420-dependent oxidoreductase [Acidimicrobiales bacterium]|nr:LLM class F420-dependent oxidoreductase [Acidimicrobiales bacterium]